MKRRGSTGDKREVREEMHLTRPPRLEGIVKNAKMNPVRKEKKSAGTSAAPHKPQSYSAQQRKEYHLRSKRRS